jgi:hypothetical protein
MARRGRVGDFGEARCVESICAEKGACPTRSYYWAGDLPFRRRFHAAVEGMSPPEGEPFAALPLAGPRSLPLHPAAPAPVR